MSTINARSQTQWLFAYCSVYIGCTSHPGSKFLHPYSETASRFEVEYHAGSCAQKHEALQQEEEEGKTYQQRGKFSHCTDMIIVGV